MDYNTIYTPKPNKEDDLNRLFEFVEKNSFGSLITVENSGDVKVTHIPFMIK